MKKTVLILFLFSLLASCKDKFAPLKSNALKPQVVTEATLHDTDDPAIWIHPSDPKKSLILGTDKDSNGALYLFDFEGKIVRKTATLKRPNNVDVAYGLMIGGQKVAIAVLTERETNSIRVFSLPDLKPIDGGGIPVFGGEQDQDPMGIALYTRPRDSAIFAIVGRKSGPTTGYLWQYRLTATKNGLVVGQLVRKFGSFSGKKEIEAIAVDNELGFVYYSDEQFGIKKYAADPEAKDNRELALFGKNDFVGDNEGIAIYKKPNGSGYILVSNQQNNTFMVYPREGTKGNPNNYPLLAEIPTSTIECDGAEVSALNFGPSFPEGVFVAMTNGRRFHLYDWRLFQALIDDKVTK